MQHAKDLWRESNRLYCMCIEYLLIARSSGCNSYFYPLVSLLFTLDKKSHWYLQLRSAVMDTWYLVGTFIFATYLPSVPIQALLVHCSVGGEVEGETDVKDTTNSNHRTLSLASESVSVQSAVKPERQVNKSKLVAGSWILAGTPSFSMYVLIL